MKKNKDAIKHFVVGVDGGGTKTDAALADLKGRILKKAKTGPSKPRNVGTEVAVLNITKAIKQVLLRKGRVVSLLVSVGGAEEVVGFKKELKKKISRIFGYKIKIKIMNDHVPAFCSGTDEKNGVLVISGTGCGIHAWKDGSHVSAGGFGWLGDEGSAFWIGRRVYQAVLKDIDGRGPDTMLTNMLASHFCVKKTDDFDFKNGLSRKVYCSDIMMTVPFLSVLCERAVQKKDKVAKKIMKEAGLELALSAKTVIKKLCFSREKFPLVLVGGVFNSNLVFNTFKKETKKTAPKADIILVKDPVIGAIKLALQNI